MSYRSWFDKHGAKHKAIVTKLAHLSDDALIEYFRFENMCIEEPDFCPLYAKNKKCHDIELLNCYLCACPNFRFDDDGFREEEGKSLFSYCDIDSKDGKQFINERAIHQDCSNCLVPHREAYIKEHFDRDWFSIMGKVTQD